MTSSLSLQARFGHRNDVSWNGAPRPFRVDMRSGLPNWVFGPIDGNPSLLLPDHPTHPPGAIASSATSVGGRVPARRRTRTDGRRRRMGPSTSTVGAPAHKTSLRLRHHSPFRPDLGIEMTYRGTEPRGLSATTEGPVSPTGFSVPSTKLPRFLSNIIPRILLKLSHPPQRRSSDALRLVDGLPSTVDAHPVSTSTHRSYRTSLNHASARARKI